MRSVWIDIAKGIGILLVVVAHIDNSKFADFIFLFHMPLFFMLSGLLMRPMPWVATEKSRIWALLVPYSCYLLILGAPEILAAPLATLKSFAFGGRMLNGKLGVFWFLTSLFLAQAVFLALLNLRKTARDPVLIGSALALAGLGYLSAPFSFPWNAGVVPTAVFFLWAGNAIGRDGVSKTLVLFAALVSLSAVVVLKSTSTSRIFDMKYGLLGPAGYGLVVAAALSILTLASAKWLEKIVPLSLALSYLGRASITIMFVHQFVHFAMANQGFGLPVQIFASILVPCFLHQLIQRAGPLKYLLLGKRPAESA